MRPDGTKTRGMTAITRAIPHIMPRRYDAQNYITEYADMEILKAYTQSVKRTRGIRVSHMALIIAAYYKTALRFPYINRFIMNRTCYDRDHFCVSFVILKKRADGTPDETPCKIFLEPGDDLFSINQKVEDIIKLNQIPVVRNNTDKFVDWLCSVPGLMRLVIGLAYRLDQWGLLPRKIIDLSPFHTSLFITNLASINTGAIYHHIYEFGTTGIFVSMGKPIPNYFTGDISAKLIPLAFVLDERICTGNEYARVWQAFRRYLRRPELLEGAFDQAAAGGEEPSAGE